MNITGLIKIDMSKLNPDIKNVYFKAINSNDIYKWDERLKSYYYVPIRILKTGLSIRCFLRSDFKDGRIISDSQLFKAGILSCLDASLIEKVVEVPPILPEEDSVWISKIGEIRTLDGWRKDAECAYQYLGIEVPIKWWEKWVRILGLKEQIGEAL